MTFLIIRQFNNTNNKSVRSGSSTGGNNRPGLYQVSHHHTSSNKSTSLGLAVDRRELMEKYENRKKAENEFKLIKANITYIENILAKNPSLQSYYSMWMFQAKQALKECISIIEAPDNVSFSVRFSLFESLKSFISLFSILIDLFEVGVWLFQRRGSDNSLSPSIV